MIPVGLYQLFKRATKVDPTRTLTLRNNFAQDFKNRFRAIKNLIRTSIVKNDCFGLKKAGYGLLSSMVVTPSSKNTSGWKTEIYPITYRQYAGQNDGDKIDNFLDWLEENEDIALFQEDRTGRSTKVKNSIWADIYIRAAYLLGMQFARNYIKKNDNLMKKLDIYYDINTDSSAILSDFMIRDVHSEAVDLIYNRVYTDLEGITSTIEANLRRILSDGLVAGESPLKIAKDIVKKIDSIGINRAELIARTETIRAHHQASINEYERYGVDKVKIEVEWVTAFDPCSICAELSGKFFTLKEIYTMIPKHPRCRCVAVPIVEE